VTRNHLPDRIQDDWEQVRSVCETFLWLDRERQTPAELFWKQITESDQRQGDARQQPEQLP
jgi:hypothetical protein